ncbi:MAG TPA: hypothetical protein VMJ34_15920 [Bryobacteraceae bacterium]|nr:hypothetical protein [Bryobacteraceae bacterium]
MARTLALLAAMAVLFCVVVLVLNQVMPGPHRPTDYLVMGGAATMVCLLVMFVLLITTTHRSANIFFRKKK